MDVAVMLLPNACPILRLSDLLMDATFVGTQKVSMESFHFNFL